MTNIWESFIPLKVCSVNDNVYLISIKHMENRHGRVDPEIESRHLIKNCKNSGLKSCLTYCFDNFYTN